MKRKEDNQFIVGIVRTNIHGSECEFEVCTRDEWDAMTEDERDKALAEAAANSGMYEIFLKSDD